jgi:hypothetical protein
VHVSLCNALRLERGEKFNDDFELDMEQFNQKDIQELREEMPHYVSLFTCLDKDANFSKIVDKVNTAGEKRLLAIQHEDENTRRLAEQETDFVTFMQPGFDPELLNRDTKIWDNQANDLNLYQADVEHLL